ncbi:hypothetical protein [Streptomyces curacoi]|uniref:hypothetical protein n=1 Tax=Streptomyces curacoi TaxID=146536 RepID=UPI00131C4D05|nr:hypothetical protein [Streptomyces curacoi]
MVLSATGFCGIAGGLRIGCGYRPGTQRTLPVACSAANSTSLSLKIDFRSNSPAALGNRTGATAPWVSLNGVMYLL